MTHTRTGTPICSACGDDLVLELDPIAPRDGEVEVLLADPPYHYACASPTCGIRQVP